MFSNQVGEGTMRILSSASIMSFYLNIFKDGFTAFPCLLHICFHLFQLLAVHPKISDSIDDLVKLINQVSSAKSVKDTFIETDPWSLYIPDFFPVFLFFPFAVLKNSLPFPLHQLDLLLHLSHLHHVINIIFDSRFIINKFISIYQLDLFYSSLPSTSSSI